MAGFVGLIWRTVGRRPNQGFERDDSLYPQVGEAFPPDAPPGVGRSARRRFWGRLR